MDPVVFIPIDSCPFETLAVKNSAKLDNYWESCKKKGCKIPNDPKNHPCAEYPPFPKITWFHSMLKLQIEITYIYLSLALINVQFQGKLNNVGNVG